MKPSSVKICRKVSASTILIGYFRLIKKTTLT